MNAARIQLGRAVRYLQRMQQLSADDGGYDDVLGFFQNCWHVKEHAKSCISAPLQQKLETDVSGSKVLRIVADLANRAKHVTLTRIRENADITFKAIHAHDGPGALQATARYTVSCSDGSSHDVHVLAAEAVREWERLLPTFSL